MFDGTEFGWVDDVTDLRVVDGAAAAVPDVAVVVWDAGGGDSIHTGDGTIAPAGVTAVAMDTTCVAVCAKSGTTVTAIPVSPTAALLAVWAGYRYDLVDVPVDAVLIAAAFSAVTMTRFADQADQVDPFTGYIGHDDVMNADIGAFFKGRSWSLRTEDRPRTWEELRVWFTTVDSSGHHVAGRSNADQFAVYLTALIGTPERAAWMLVPFIGIPAARTVLVTVTAAVGVPDRYPTYDQTVGAYIQPTVGAAADLDPRATTEDWPFTLFGVPLTAAQVIETTVGISSHIEVSDPDATATRVDIDEKVYNTATVDEWVNRRRHSPAFVSAARTVLADSTRVDVHGIEQFLWSQITEIDNDLDPSDFSQFIKAKQAAVWTAVPFWMPSALAVSVAGSHLPDQELMEWLRLPERSLLIMFSHDLRLDDVITKNLDPLEGATDPMSFIAGWDGSCGGWGSTLGEMARHGGGITGIVVFADPDGRLADTVVWVVNVNRDPRSDLSDTLPYRTLWGSLNHSTLRHAVQNWVAYLTWGDTQPPSRRLDLPPLGDTAGWRKLVRTSQFRKAVTRDGVDDRLRVVTLQPPSTSPSTIGNDPQRTVAPHLRRGHWRRSRIATRDANGNIVGDVHGVFGKDWRYVGRWIPPVAVKGGPATDLRVYRVPTPAD